MGSTVVAGRGILRITKTGIQTALGQIAASLSGHVEEETPLRVRLKAFSRDEVVVHIECGLDTRFRRVDNG